MKAVTMHEYGGPDVLKLEDVPKPDLRPGHVLVRVRAASVNPFDTKVRRGFLRSFFDVDMPHILGADYAGEVEAVGPGVMELALGDRVWGLTIAVFPGSYAEYVVLPAAIVRRMPANLDFPAAAAVPMGGMTAWYALHTLGGLAAGQRVLVHGGAGGVGSYAVQIAKAAGAEVIATCSTANVEYVRALGADRVIDYQTQDFTALVQDADLAVDPLGGETNLRTYTVMRRGGTIVVVLRGDRTEIENRERLKALHGVSVKVVEYDNAPDILDSLKRLFEAGTMRSTLETVLPLEQAAAAQIKAETGHARGKTVLAIG